MTGWRMVLDERHKLVLREGAEPMLFDMREDPRETRSVADEEPEIVAQLKKQLARGNHGK